MKGKCHVQRGRTALAAGCFLPVDIVHSKPRKSRLVLDVFVISCFSKYKYLILYIPCGKISKE
jgi:hypothetical protein